MDIARSQSAIPNPQSAIRGSALFSLAPRIRDERGAARGSSSGLGEAAITAGRSDTFLGARYRRIVRRRGKKKAMVAVGRSILVIVWHLLADPDTRFHDLGPDHFDRRVTTDANSRPSATGSPSNQPPDIQLNKRSRLRRELSRARSPPFSD